MVGIKFERTSIEKPKTIVTEVFKIAIPTVQWHHLKFYYSFYIFGIPL